jgi:uncharacterized protein
MPRKIVLGTAVSQPGTIQYGQWHAFTHTTGLDEFLPVIIAQGHEDGPCFWLTAGIHGTEHSGPWVLYDLLTPALVDRLKGTIVAIPALCPVGLRTHQYVPYIVDKNPNRLWPDGKPFRQKDPEKAPPTPLEETYGRLFEEMQKTADFLIDYHNAGTDSISFVFRDRLLYRADENKAENQKAAEELSDRLAQMLRAYGHTIVNEFPVEHYIEHDLHRSTSGAALLLGRIPAFTAELGTGHMPNPAITRAAVAGTRNVLRWAGMLADDPEPIEGIKLVNLDFPMRRTNTVRAPVTCVALHLVEAGDIVQAGTPLAELRDIWGRLLPQSPLRAAHDGCVLGRGHGIFYAQGDTVIYMGIRDSQPMVGAYPDDFFQEPASDSTLPLNSHQAIG